MYIQNQHVSVSNSDIKIHWIILLLLAVSSSSDAVTLSGSPEYAVPGTKFTLTCDVPEEANSVQFYRRPNVTTTVGVIQVAGDQCYNIQVSPAVPCTSDVCSCVTCGVTIGTVFRWIIQPQTGDHGSVWYCTRTNLNLPDQTLDSDDYTLTVADGPGDSTVFDPPQNSVDIIENQTISDVRCSADCRPACTYTWSRSGTDYTNPLSLSVATRTNAGQYTCTARNIVSQGTKTWNLIVRFPPRILSLDYTDGNSDVAENGPKSLMCSVESSPPSTIQWFYKANNTDLLTTPDVLESTYTLTNADCLDTGLYTCSIRNSVSNTAVTRDIPINVLCEPRRVVRNETDQKYNLETGNILVMYALFLSNPEPTFSWSFQASPDTVVTPLVDGTDNFAIHNTFVMMNLSAVSVGTRTDIREAWFGVYGVTATNSQGSNTFSFIVKGKNMPKLPKSLSVSCGNPHSVEVMWNNGGNTEYFRVLYSTDNSLQSVIDPATIFKQVDGNDVYSVTIDKLGGGQLYFFKIVAYNSHANITSLESSGCRVQEGKGRLPFRSSKCQQCKNQGFDQVQFSGRGILIEW
ncbi:hemicentin-2-like [Pecten maximus]|uniref:hemicentin-2-like n=1 Tax=Pecten maximus TaxID=6579 RepID=UPI0014583A35|nr:hemicentin-2-like [Pecten maximus]